MSFPLSLAKIASNITKGGSTELGPKKTATVPSDEGQFQGSSKYLRKRPYEYASARDSGSLGFPSGSLKKSKKMKTHKISGVRKYTSTSILSATKQGYVYKPTGIHAHPDALVTPRKTRLQRKNYISAKLLYDSSSAFEKEALPPPTVGILPTSNSSQVLEHKDQGWEHQYTKEERCLLREFVKEFGRTDLTRREILSIMKED